MRIALLTCLLLCGHAIAAPKAPPVNIVNATASWQKDTAVCQRYVAQNWTLAVVATTPGGPATALVCSSSGGATICNATGGTPGTFADGFNNGTAAMNKADGTDERSRLKMFYGCMDDMGWRQP